MEIDPLWLLRIFTVIPVVLIVLAGGGVLWIYFFVISLLPEGQSRVDLPGLTAEVRVVRDGRGVPGILGENEEDVAQVLGYVMAQDRLWQMDYLRRASQGRLAEILGAEYLDSDHLMRTVAAGGLQGGRAARLGERERRWLHRFVRGINTYISTHAGKLPVEFSLLEYRPEPFSEEDVLGIFLAPAWESSPASRVDPTMTRILGRLGKKRALELFPADTAASPGFVSADLEGWEPAGILFDPQVEIPSMMHVPGLRGGCAWAVGPGKTRSGNPMAGCMVYQALAAPGFWYRARLVAGDFNLSGAFVPGVPVALVGANAHIAWGCISSPGDDADLYIERVDSDPPKRYWRMDRWRNLKEQRALYRIRGGSSVSRLIRLTETGPLVSEVRKGRAISLRWTARDGLGLFPAFYTVNRARTGNDIRTALKSLTAPSLNVVWADSGGGFGIQLAGLLPVRPPGSDGIIPMPAWTGVHDWRGFIPFDQLPSSIDPVRGLAAVADGRPGGASYPLFVSCYWNDRSRRRRIRELLGQGREHSRDSFQKIQMDTLSPLARDLTPVLLRAVDQGNLKGSGEKKAVDALRSWDFRMSKKSVAAAVFALVYQSLVEELFLKTLGEHNYQGFTGYYPLAARMVRKIFVDGQVEWLQGVQREKVLRKSFKQAVSLGADLMGNDPEQWKWGSIHKTVFRHLLTTRSRFLEILYNVGPIPVAGSGDTLQFAGWSNVHPFQVLAGVSLREISDMTHPPEMFGISPMGSSAHFFSTHYKDQISAWANGRSFREPVEKSDIRQSGFNAVLFSPTRSEKVSRR